MEIIDFVALTIVALVIFMFVYRFYFKKQHRTISSVNNKAVSANSVSCVPENGASKTHECLATIAKMAGESIAQVLRGEVPANAVNAVNATE